MVRKERINNFLLTLFGFKKSRGWQHFFIILLIHAIAWSIFLLLPLLFYPVRFSGDPVWRRELVTKVLPIVLFYANYYFFLPRYFEKKKVAVYCTLVLLAVFTVAATDVYIRSKLLGRPAMQGRVPVTFNDTLQNKQATFITTDSAAFRFPPMMIHEKKIWGIPRSAIFFSINRTISTCIFLLLLGGLIRLAYSFLKNQNEKRTLENANLNAEVNFLKSQINPHFLFNTLNSIYSQAHVKSDNTEFSILKLSELLRYVLYESGSDKVELAKDIQYINNYIDLQRLRLSPKITLHYTVQGDVQHKKIAPLLLINFIENAFKHGISYTQASTININILIFEKTLTLSVTNPIVEKDSFVVGGLGIKNVTRRLALLYPDQHNLTIHSGDDLHIVTLKLNLDHA